jgi:hypothetical protein
VTQTYHDIPLPHSEFGEELYLNGRRLVRECGVRLDEIVWDADEVLWDWLMDARRMLKRAPASLMAWDLDFGHREFYLVKPGVFELIWGMRHESLERELDPYMRVWTNGYPWRLWRVAHEIPGFATLVGPPARERDDEHLAFSDHPRIFYRTDYARVAHKLLDPDGFSELASAFPDHVRELVSSQFERDPFDSSFKLPEFASVCGKGGFGCARVLIDDARRNVGRFVASGRHGVHVVSKSPRFIFGAVPNTVWGSPRDALAPLSNRISQEIADALEKLACRDNPTHLAVASDDVARGHVPIEFHIDVPDRMIRSEWIDPIKDLKRTWTDALNR